MNHCFYHAVALFFVAILAVASDPLVAAESTPNIVIVLADDLGWGDPQCYQAGSKIPTPAIDRLAAEGMRFTDAHTPSSVCTPTRYTLLTGRYAWRTRLKSGVLDGFDPPLISPDEETLATLLKRAGYQTHCIGKWHLGMQWTKKDGTPVTDRVVAGGFRQGVDVDFSKPFTGGPLDVGFDSYFGIAASLDMSPYAFLRSRSVESIPTIETAENRDGLFMNQVAGVTTEDFALVDVLPRIATEASRIIRDAADDAEPFFCYVPLTSPHLPVVPPPEANGKSDAGSYGDFVVATDNALGKILQALDDTDQANSTLVLFTSDNGGLFHQWQFRADDDGGAAPVTKRGGETFRFGHQSNADWRGTKADIFEGGHRVPFLVRWPGQTPASTVSDATIELTDVFATLCQISGQSPRGESGTDSFSMLDVLKGKTNQVVRPFAIHHSVRGMFAIRRGGWKLILGRGSGGFTRPNAIKSDDPAGQLYALNSDPRETTNRYNDEPARVEEMTGLLQAVQSTSARQTASSLTQ